MERDFTYVSDIAKSFYSALVTKLDYEIINLGSNRPVKLLDFIDTIEALLGIKADKNFLPLQSGDVVSTWADITKANNLINYNPEVSIREGLENFIDWYKSYYDIA